MSIGGLTLKPGENLTTFKHTFSHFHLDITPVRAQIIEQQQKVTEASKQVWYKPHSQQQIGLAAPIKKLLESL